METQKTQIAVMAEKILNIERGVANIQGTLEKNYVTSDKHALLQAEVARQGKIIYFAIAIFGAAFLGAVANFFIK